VDWRSWGKELKQEARRSNFGNT